MMKIEDGKYFSAPYTPRMHYVVATPEQRSGKLPMMVFLHGLGERGEDARLLGVHGPLKLALQGREFPCILLCPQCPLDRFWMQIPFQLHELILQVAADYDADPDRISVTGLSMGGYGTWELAMSFPETFSAIAPCCGGGVCWRVGVLKDTPVWACHGDKDGAVPIQEGYAMIDYLIKLGGSPRFTVLHNVGHDSWNEFYENTNVLDWMLAQKRGEPAKRTF